MYNLYGNEKEGRKEREVIEGRKGKRGKGKKVKKKRGGKREEG